MNTNRTTRPLIAADTAVQTLVKEGYDRDDILAAYDSLIEAGLETPNDENSISAEELDILREQLNS
jgi:hypothetical protein